MKHPSWARFISTHIDGVSFYISDVTPGYTYALCSAWDLGETITYQSCRTRLGPIVRFTKSCIYIGEEEN